jgi:hypothetical protein
MFSTAIKEPSAFSAISSSSSYRNFDSRHYLKRVYEGHGMFTAERSRRALF